MQIYSLNNIWGTGSRVWVTHPAADTEDLLQDETVVWAHAPTTRNLFNLVRNLILAFRVLRAERPDAVLSTGAGVSVPFVWMAKWLGIQTIFIEDLTRVSGLSLSGKLVYRVADLFLVQWPELLQQYPRARYQGRFL